jgi:hypothetical protein
MAVFTKMTFADCANYIKLWKLFNKLKPKTQKIIFMLFITALSFFCYLQYRNIAIKESIIKDLDNKNKITELQKEILHHCSYGINGSERDARVRRKQCFEIYENFLKDFRECDSIGNSHLDLNESEVELEKKKCINKVFHESWKNFHDNKNNIEKILT